MDPLASKYCEGHAEVTTTNEHQECQICYNQFQVFVAASGHLWRTNIFCLFYVCVQGCTVKLALRNHHQETLPVLKDNTFPTEVRAFIKM